MYYSTTYLSPLGVITLASKDDNLIGLWNEGQKYHGVTLFNSLVTKDDQPLFNMVKQWLEQYFSGEQPSVSQLPLTPLGSEFRQAVWSILSEIPYGQVITYGDIAQKMAARMNKASMSSRAVGGAVGHNPISIIIPCHRVVGANGSLTGYAGGIDAKIKLLELEGVNMSQLSEPQTVTN